MTVAKMRWLDRWLGTPVCFLLTLWRKVFGWRDPGTGYKPRRILFVKLAEQGSTVLAQGALKSAISRVGRENVFFLLFAENRPILDILDLIPKENVKDLEEIPENVKRDLTLIPVDTVDDVLRHALVRMPEAVEWKDPKEAATTAPVAAATPPTDGESGIITH